jgi:hypothetical protein
MTLQVSRVASPNISPDDMVGRLMRAHERDIADIVSVLAPHERARLAFFCYARGHLHDIGIAVAATCDLSFLMQAAPSNAAAQTLFARSRERLTATVAPASRRRSAVTLAKSALGNDALARIMASIADDETDLAEPAADIAPAADLAPTVDLALA